MRHLTLGLALATLVTARPDLYREKEDFQYSRSSSDDGTKSGYYDAQRGNMGGNYERAHNMDTLAQHQMGGLVNQVEGELADGSKTRTGSVYSSANTRGVFGSGHYDLSNLQGRNFQEGTAYDNSQLHSLSNSAAHSSSLSKARYSSSGHSDNSDYRGYQTNNLQDAQTIYGTHQHEQGSQTGSDSRYLTQSGYRDRNIYAQSQLNIDEAAQNLDANTHHRLISTVPVKIIVRPGQRIAIPIATQTYRDSHIASYHDQNAINSESEILNSNGLQENIKPAGTGKHYESAYSYHKEWQKHDTRPAVVPAINPVLKNSEAYRDSSLNYGSQNSGNRYEHSSDQSAAFSQSRYETDLNAQHKSSTSLNSNSNAYSQLEANSGLNSHSADLVGTIGSRPKSYQSSYSYHKSWERQGDPYVIKPASNGVFDGQQSGRLTDASASQDLYSQGYGYNCMYECKPSHTRVARSYRNDNAQMEQQQSQILEDMGQQTQTQWNNFENLNQQTQDQWGQSEYSGQQLQSNWENNEDLGQQTQVASNLEDLGQQIQTVWDKTGDSGQQTQHLENFNQQSQSKLNNFEDLGQQTQNTFDNIEDPGQQPQSKWDIQNTGQQSQNQFDAVEDLGQQTQNNWDQQEDLGQQSQTQWNINFTGQQTQANSEYFRHQQKDHGQHELDKWDQLDKAETNPLESTDQKPDHKWSPVDSNKHFEFNNKFYKVQNEDIQQPQTSSQIHSIWNKIDNSEVISAEEQTSLQQQTFQQGGMTKQLQKIDDRGVSQQPETTSYQSQSIWDKIENLNQGKDSSNERDITNQKPQGIWDVIYKKEESLNKNHSTINHTIFKNMSSGNISQETGSLNGLWGKVGNLDGDNSVQKIHYENTRELSTEEPNIYTQISNIESTTDVESQPTTEKVYNNKLRPADIGRGDIGPEDSIMVISSTERNYRFSDKNKDQYNNNYTSNSEINIHRLTRFNNSSESIMHEGSENVTYNQSMLKYGSNNRTEVQKIENELRSQNTGPINSFVQQSNISLNLEQKDNKNLNQQNTQHSDNDNMEQQSSWNIEQKQNQELNQQNTQHFNSFDQQSNIEQLSKWNKEEKENQYVNQRNMEPLTSFEQQINTGEHSVWNIEQKQNHGFNQQDMQQFNTFDQQSIIEQQSNWNTEQKDKSFSQQNMELLTSFDQQSNTEQSSDRNIEQKPNQDFNQQSMQNFNSYDQQSNIDKHSSSNLEQKENQYVNEQNMESLTSFDQQSSTEQESNGNIEQKQNHGFNQQDMQQFNTFDQQSIIEQQSNWNTEQKDKSFSQQNMELLTSFDQQSNTEQSSDRNIEQKPNQDLNQQGMQNYNSYDQQSNIEKHSSWNLEQKENQYVNQQNMESLTSFDQQSSTEQESNWNIEQKQNKDFNEHRMQNFNSYDQQSTIEKYSSRNSEPKENQGINQQNLEDLINFDQQSNIEQESNWYLEPQNTQHHFLEDFSQQNQDNSQYLGQQQVSLGHESHHKIIDSELVEFIPESNTDEQVGTKPKKGLTNIETIGNDMEVVTKMVYNPSYNQISTTEVKQHNNEILTSTIPTITEKPGFWKSVGNKFKNAKDKVSSWFGR